MPSGGKTSSTRRMQSEERCLQKSSQVSFGGGNFNGPGRGLRVTEESQCNRRNIKISQNLATQKYDLRTLIILVMIAEIKRTTKIKKGIYLNAGWNKWIFVYPHLGRKFNQDRQNLEGLKKNEKKNLQNKNIPN